VSIHSSRKNADARQGLSEYDQTLTPSLILFNESSSKVVLRTHLCCLPNTLNTIYVKYIFITLVSTFIDEGFCEVIFVKTEENQSDGFTKNLGRELHEKHTKNFIKSKEEI